MNLDYFDRLYRVFYHWLIQNGITMNRCIQVYFFLFVIDKFMWIWIFREFLRKNGSDENVFSFLLHAAIFLHFAHILDLDSVKIVHKCKIVLRSFVVCKSYLIEKWSSLLWIIEWCCFLFFFSKILMKKRRRKKSESWRKNEMINNNQKLTQRNRV